MMRNSMPYMCNSVRFLLFLFLPPDDKTPYPRQKDNNYCGVAEPEVNFVSVSIGAFADNNVYTVTPVLQL